ncbi:MAG: DUF47 family protein [Candidatus Omnitrophota bacterium]|jgi:hypothetical protein
MFSRLLPKESDFFSLFDKQANFAIDAACHFREVVTRNRLDDATLQKMKDIEHQGDTVAREIIDRLDKTFITPFDREDIHKLTKEIDDIIDMMNTITNRLRVYNLDGTDKNLVAFSEVIEQSVRAVAYAVKGMRNMKQTKAIMDSCGEVNRLENVGDDMRDKMLAELFEKFKADPIFVIKWKEIYQDAETILDICEDVAHVVESILVKNA